MATIDRLDIQIEGSAQKANVAINDLIKNLDRLANSLKIDTSGLEKIGKSLKLNGIDKAAKNVQSQMKNIEKSIENPLNKTEDTIQKMIKSFQKTFSESGKDFKFEGNAGQLEKEIQKANAELDRLEKRKARAIELKNYGSLKGIIRDVENATNRLKILEDARPDALNRTLEETQKKAKESEAALSEMNAKLKDLVVPPIREDNIEKLQSMLKKAEEELNRLRAKLKNGLTMGTINQSADDKGFQNLSAQIAVAEKRAGTLRQKIQDIGGSPKSTAGLEALSSAFRGLGEAAGKAATMIKNALKGIASVVSGAFSKIGQIGSRTARTIKNVASNIASSFAKIGSSSKSLKTAHSNLGNLLKTALGFATLRGVFNFAKEAVNLGSSITEVENVVNTAFGSMAQHAYDFASTATEQFGLSELAAKQYSGTMMAMLKSSGVAQAQAAKMSTTLAGLAGDIASFYNIETDEAFYKLRAAISGETEPMKALGVNMNVVNLEAFAMSQGINKAYREMALAEQATLRYNYIMAKTTDAQGDFARTVDSFANQWRLLKLNIQSVAAVLGQGIIAGILPIIKALNALMGKLMQAAKAFRNFMYVLMGKKIETTTSGIVNDLAGIGDASDGFGDLGDAAEEAGKKINKNLLLPIDELNILTDTSDDLKDALGGIGDVDMGMGDAFEGLTEEPVNEWAKRIRDAFLAQDWEELGKTIAELVNIGLKKVYDAIIDITPKVEKALKAFAEVFNSFVKYLDWDLLGRTIGAGINLITTAINALLGDDGIDFEQLGSKLSVGFRGMIDEIDWTGLGNAIGNWFMVAWRIADGFIQDMWRVSTETMKNGWEELGEAVGEGVNGVFDRIQFDQIARVLTEGFRGILESAASALDTIRFDEIAEKINAGLAVLENGIRWEHIGEQITKFTSAVSKAFNDLLKLDFGNIGRIIGNGITDIVRAFNQLTGEGGLDFERLGTNISNGLRNLFASIPWAEFGNALGNGFMIGWRILDGFVTDVSQKDGAGLTGWSQLGISIGNAINGVFEKVDFASIANVLVAGFNGVIESLKNFITTMEWGELAANLTNGLNTFIHGADWANAGKTLSDFVKNLLGVFQKAAQETDWKGFGKGIVDFLSNIDWKGILETVFDIIKNTLGGLIDGLKETSVGKIGLAVSGGILAFKGFEQIVPIAELIFGPKGKLIAELVAGIAGMITAIGIGGKDLSGAIIDMLGGLLDSAIEALNNINWEEVAKNIIDFMFDPKWYSLTGKVLELAWALVKGLANGIWENIKKITWEDIWNWILECFKNLFGIHSPSTVMEEQGGFLMQGLINGIRAFIENVVNTFGEIKDKIIEAWSNIKQAFEDKWSEIVDWWKNSAISKWWENDVKPWFTSEKWSELYNTIKDRLKAKWDETVGQWISGIENWWKDHVAPWFTFEKWSDLYDTVKTRLKSKWDETVGEWAQGIRNWWDDKVKPWFTSEKWSELYNTIKDRLKAKWDETVGEWAQGIRNWWDDKVKPWFTKEKWGELYKNIKISLEEKWNNLVDWWKNSAISKWWNENVKPWFDKDKWSFDGIKEGLSEAWKKAVEAVKGVWNTFAGWLNNNLKFEIPPINVMGMQLFGGATIDLGKIPTFSAGGFPEDGLFMANHTELVGRFSNGRTAVANNEQIIAGIEEAAYRGFLRAQAETSPYLADIAENTRRTAEKDMSVRIGDRDIHEANKRAEERLGWTF